MTATQALELVPSEAVLARALAEHVERPAGQDLKLTLDRYFTMDGGRLGARYATDYDLPFRAGGFIYLCPSELGGGGALRLFGLPFSVLRWPHDDKLPALRTLDLSALDLLQWRPLRRAVFRRTASAGPPTYLKVLRRRDFERMRRLFKECGETLAASQVVVADRVDPARRCFEFSAAPGRALHDRLLAGEKIDVRQLVEGIEKFRRSGKILTYHASCRPFAKTEELRVVERFVGLASTVRPDSGLRLKTAVRRLPDYDAASSIWELLHRDLHDKQIFLDADRIALIDVDTLAHGPRGLDAANLATHLLLRDLQGAAGNGAVLARQWLEAVVRRGMSREELRFFFCTSLLRLSCVYLLRPAQDAVASRLLAHLEQVQQGGNPGALLP